MTFRVRILIAMALAALLPLSLLGVLSDRTARAQLLAQAESSQAQLAREIARQCDADVAAAANALALAAGYIPFDQLSDAELGEVLTLPYRQLGQVQALALLDEKGDAVVPPLYEPDPLSYPDLAGRAPFTEASLDRFARQIPLAAALQSKVAVGPPYRGETSKAPRVALAVRLERGRAKVLAAELALDTVQLRLEELAASGWAGFLMDASGSLVGAAELQPSLSESERALAVGQGSRAGRVERGNETWLAAVEAAPRLGWQVLVERRASEALSAADRVRLYTAAWAALAALLTGVLGALLARSLSRPVAALSRVTSAATAGVYQQSPQVEGPDELGQLGRAFNHMIAEVSRRDEEIRAFNRELQQRVDERTAELKAAQDQIMRTRRLAAIGSLGAGVAHELNNPLTAILGLSTVAKKDLPPDDPRLKALDGVLEQAKRAARIVAELRRLANHEQEQAGRRLALGPLVRRALDSLAPAIQEAKVEICLELAESLPEIQGVASQIEQLVAHLARNALDAMPHGGQLKLSLSAVGAEAVKLSVADTGKGIPEELRERVFDPFFTTKSRPDQLGLGLSVCHTIAEAHHGKIAIESAAGTGTRVNVIFPAAAPGAHLY